MTIVDRLGGRVGETVATFEVRLVPLRPQVQSAYRRALLPSSAAGFTTLIGAPAAYATI